MGLSAAQRHRIEHEKAVKEAAAAEARAKAEAKKSDTRTQRITTVFETEDTPPPSDYISPAKRFRMAVAAGALIAAAGALEDDAAPPAPETGPEATEWQLLRAQLGEHMRQLSGIASIEDKIRTKRQMVDVYDAHVLGVLQAAEETGKAVQDEIFMHIMIWRFDIGDFGMALDMAAHALRFKLAMPERYNRNTATYIGDAVADAALHAQALEQAFDYQTLNQTVAMISDQNVNDIVRAKLERALGTELDRLAENMEPDSDGPAGARRAAQEQALAHYRRAYELHKPSGVKKAMDRMAGIIAKYPKAAPAA